MCRRVGRRLRTHRRLQFETTMSPQTLRREAPRRMTRADFRMSSRLRETRCQAVHLHHICVRKFHCRFHPGADLRPHVPSLVCKVAHTPHGKMGSWSWRQGIRGLPCRELTAQSPFSTISPAVVLALKELSLQRFKASPTARTRTSS